MAENEIESIIRATNAMSTEPKAYDSDANLAGTPQGTDSIVSMPLLGPLRGGIYQFSTGTNCPETEDLSWASLSSDESEGNDDDDDDDDDEDDDGNTDEVDHNLWSCVIPTADNVASDGGGFSHQKARRTDAISLPEARPQSRAIIRLNLHPDLKVNEIINETIATERIFVGRLLQLKALKEVIEDANSRHPFINENDIGAMFPDLGPVLDLHREHLLPALEKEALRSESSSTAALIGDIFKQHVRFFMHHKQLICKQHQSKSTITKLTKENKLLRENMKELQETFRTTQVNTEIILAEPHRKLHNFTLLFQRYIKALNEQDAGKQDLQNAEAALAEMERVLNSMDEASKKEKMQHDLLSLRPRFRHLGLDIMRAHRELRDADDFRIYDPRRDNLRRCKAYLLDDMVLIHRKGTIHEVIWCIGLRRAMVEIEEGESCHNDSYDKSGDLDDHHTCMLVIYGHEAVVELETDSRATAENWRMNIETTTGGQAFISYRAEDPHFPTGRRAPRLQRIKSVRSCQRCHLVFNRQTKQHCEACGFVVCRQCSKYERVLPFSPRQKAQRVCKHCEDRLNIDSGQ